MGQIHVTSVVLLLGHMIWQTMPNVGGLVHFPHNSYVYVGVTCALASVYSNPLGTYYRSGTVNSNTVNSKFRLIRSYCEIFFYHFPNISCLKCTVNSNFHLIRSKTLLNDDFELTVYDLYIFAPLWESYGIKSCKVPVTG